MPTALIVSHGQPSDPDTGEAEIRAFAAAVRQQAEGVDVRGVTLAAPGAVEAMASEAGPEAVVYPMFMADGWFTSVQLPKRLGDAGLRVLPPFGTDTGLPGFAAGWLGDVLAMRGWATSETTLIVLGHGSGRSERPAEVTREFAQNLQDECGFAALNVGFVEQAPFLTDALKDAPRKSICLPFFATRRGHVRDDVPEALEAAGFAGQVLDPIGLHPCIPGFIAQRLMAATA